MILTFFFLEIGTGCKAWAEQRGIKRFELTSSGLENFKAWIKKDHSLERVATLSKISPMKGWTDGLYYNSYYRIYAMNEWIKTQPACVDR